MVIQLIFAIFLILQEPITTANASDRVTSVITKYMNALNEERDPDNLPLTLISRLIGPDWHRLARVLDIPDSDIKKIRQQLVGKEAISVLRIWIHLKKQEASRKFL